jgi:hypothetical protein
VSGSAEFTSSRQFQRSCVIDLMLRPDFMAAALPHAKNNGTGG